MPLHFINLLSPDCDALPDHVKEPIHSITISDSIRNSIFQMYHDNWYSKLMEWCNENLEGDTFLLHTPGGFIFVAEKEADIVAFKVFWS